MGPSRRTMLIATVLYALVLTNLLLAPHPLWMFGLTGDMVEESVNRALADYIQHGISYALLTAFVIAAVRPKAARGLGVCVALALAHGLGTESLQALIPLRDCEFSDVLANSIGVATGFVTVVVVFRIRTVLSRRSTIA